MNRRCRLGTLIAALAAAPAGFAVDSFHVELGAGDDDAKRAGFYLSWLWDTKWFAEGDWYLGGYWEIGGSYWDASPGRTGNDSLGEGGAAAVLRLEPHKPMAGMTPFLEFGLGVHGYTETKL